MHQDIQPIITIIIAGTTIVIVLTVFLVSFFFVHLKKKQIHILELNQLKSAYENELLRSQLEIQEQTFKTISQEIHDNIGQVLSLAKLNLATTDIKKLETAQQKIDDSKNFIAKAIQDLRDLSKSLNTDYVEQMGLARSIEYELEMIKKTGSFETVFEIKGNVRKFGQQKELILFRIVQEVLNNIIKHAKASLIEVNLQYQADLFLINITDNGLGFDLNTLGTNDKTPAGIGVKSMRNRAQLIGADFSISSTISEGTSVSIHLPYSTNII